MQLIAWWNCDIQKQAKAVPNLLILALQEEGGPYESAAASPTL